MLTVKTYLAQSPINGLGVFASEPIAKGTTIWHFVPDFDVCVPGSQYLNLPELAREFTMHFGYLNLDDGGYILCMDNAKYMNHSMENNVGSSGKLTVALRDIDKGEELTDNYFEFDSMAVAKLGHTPPWKSVATQ